MIRLISWNVNGIRAAEKKGLLGWINKEKPDMLALQETKASSEQLSVALKNVPGYLSYWAGAEKKGYSGVALYTKIKPQKVICGIGERKFDSEGRVIKAEYEKFIFYNIYFPNGKSGPERLSYKMEFYEQFLKKAKLDAGGQKAVIICGDVNTAHNEIDLARPVENSTVSGFLPEEREWMDRFVGAGFIDTFRVFNQQPGHYSWWDLKTGARSRNVGWRIDYFFIDKKSVHLLKDAFIMKDVYGSDHCPVGIKVEL